MYEIDNLENYSDDVIAYLETIVNNLNSGAQRGVILPAGVGIIFRTTDQM